MDSIVLTEEELAQQRMHPNTLIMAKHFFDSRGFVKIDNLFPKSFIQTLASNYERNLRWSEDRQSLVSGTQVSDKRYIVPIAFSGAFKDVQLYANPLITPLWEKILGKGYILGSLGAVTSLPGALEQHIHADYRMLFEENTEISSSIPTYAITVAIPLLDIDPVNGPTKMWVGSHRTYPIDQRMRSYPVELLFGALGSCYFWDYRTFHAGGANHSELPRSLLYMSYTRSWFKDFFNPEQLHIDKEEYIALLPEQKRLFLSLQNQIKMQNT